MKSSIESLVAVVNSEIADQSEEDDARLARVGVIRKTWGVRPGMGSAMASASGLHTAAQAQDTALSYVEAEVPPAPVVEDLTRPRRGLVRRLLGRRERRKAPDVMHADAMFRERVKRIEQGRQWQPDGVLNAVGRHRRATSVPFGQRPNVRFAVLVAGALGLSVWGLGPQALTDYAQTMAGDVDLPSWIGSDGLRVASGL